MKRNVAFNLPETEVWTKRGITVLSSKDLKKVTCIFYTTSIYNNIDPETCTCIGPVLRSEKL